FTGLRPDSNFFELLLMRFVFSFLPRLFVAEFAKIHDFADWWSFVRSNFNQIKLGVAGHVKSLCCGNDAKLFSVDADKTDRTDANLLVDSLTPVVRVPIVDTPFSFATWNACCYTSGSRSRSISQLLLPTRTPDGPDDRRPGPLHNLLSISDL